jgi:hypothetical protein
MNKMNFFDSVLFELVLRDIEHEIIDNWTELSSKIKLCGKGNALIGIHFTIHDLEESERLKLEQSDRLKYKLNTHNCRILLDRTTKNEINRIVAVIEEQVANDWEKTKELLLVKGTDKRNMAIVAVTVLRG